MRIEGFRSLNHDIETIINKSEKVKKAKKEKDSLTQKEKKELSDEEKEYKSLRKQIQEKLIKFATRIPVFMYLTDYRERTLKDVITQLEPGLFKIVTGLDVVDFNLLCGLGVFNANLMNDAIFKFKRYEDSSLSYTGIDRHEGMDIGGWDTVLKKEEYEQLFYNQQATMSEESFHSDDDMEEPEPIVFVEKEEKVPLRARSALISGQYGIKPTVSMVADSSASYRHENPSRKEDDSETVKVEYDRIVVGAKVSHDKFGEGMISQIFQGGKKISVDFAEGEKSFIIEQGNKYNAFAKGLLRFV